MLAYSSISHAGFMLIPIAANNALGGRALLYYLIPYCAMSIGAFAVVAARERELDRPVTLDNLAGFGWERPLLGVSMSVFMLGFAGLPLTGGFVGKFYVFSAAYDRGWTWLVIVGVAATAVSLYYYLGVIRAMYMRPPVELQLAPVAGGSPPRELLLQTRRRRSRSPSRSARSSPSQPLIDVAQARGRLAAVLARCASSAAARAPTAWTQKTAQAGERAPSEPTAGTAPSRDRAAHGRPRRPTTQREHDRPEQRVQVLVRRRRARRRRPRAQRPPRPARPRRSA